jgi:hypothetical protein
MAAISGVDGGRGGDACDGRSRMATAFGWITRFSEGGLVEPLFSRKPAFGVHSAISSPGAEAGNGEVPGEILASVAQ